MNIVFCKMMSIDNFINNASLQNEELLCKNIVKDRMYRREGKLFDFKQICVAYKYLHT